MSLRTRLESVARRAGAGGRLIVIRPDREPAVFSTPTGLGVIVPEAFAADPVAGLSAVQRALIRPSDQLIVVKYVDRGIG